MARVWATGGFNNSSFDAAESALTTAVGGRQ